MSKRQLIGGNIIGQNCSSCSELSKYVDIVTVRALQWILQPRGSGKKFFPIQAMCFVPDFAPVKSDKTVATEKAT